MTAKKDKISEGGRELCLSVGMGLVFDLMCKVTGAGNVAWVLLFPDAILLGLRAGKIILLMF